MPGLVLGHRVKRVRQQARPSPAQPGRGPLATPLLECASPAVLNATDVGERLGVLLAARPSSGG
ncbi:MAG: hypothetical protein E6J41_32920 [Chloroflexi bacterium]|nr:MAG: hypothetical protein E6J41_32920 [Chloroflexota bacterium]